MTKKPLFFLSTAVPLSKTYTKDLNQNITKTSYPLVRDFTSYEESYTDLTDFLHLLTKHAAQGHTLLKGLLTTNLSNESRAGSTSPDTPTEWLCLDIDGLNIDSVSTLLEALDLQETQYIHQASASAGLDPSIHAHLYFLLYKPTSPQDLKNWLMYKNLSIKLLRDQVSLTKSQVAMRWPLDVSVGQNDKLIYIAPPIFVNMPDPLSTKSLGPSAPRAGAERLYLVTPKPSSSLKTHVALHPVDPDRLKYLKTKQLNSLRKAASLPAIRSTRRELSIHGVPVLKGASKCEITGVKEARGFTYLNLNGGDSWGYYFNPEHPTVLYNFKGEPNYLLGDIAPELHSTLVNKNQLDAVQQADSRSNTPVVLAFLDKTTDKYYVGKYTPNAVKRLDLHVKSSKSKVQDYLKQHNEELGEYVPTLRYEFDFKSDKLINQARNQINRYQASECLASTTRALSALPTPTIDSVIMHVVGDDIMMYDLFINWLAYIIQKREPPHTAWLFQGTQGTGKGMLFHRVLGPLVGPEYTKEIQLHRLLDPFNDYMKNNLFLLIDESSKRELRDKNMVMSKLKHYITEPTLEINAKNIQAHTCRNWANVILSTNQYDPLDLEAGDRRFFICPRQDNQVIYDHSHEELIKNELPAFASVLSTMSVDTKKARTPVSNTAKQEMIHMTRSSIDVIAHALLTGDLRYFMDQLPTSADSITYDVQQSTSNVFFFEFITRCFDVVHNTSINTMRIPRDDLRNVFTHLTDNVPKSPNKFTSLIKHHGILLKPIRYNNALIRGFETTWQVDSTLITDWAEVCKLHNKPHLREVR